MTAPERDGDLNRSCTARTGVGVSVVAIIAVVLAVMVVGLWLL